MQFCWVRWATPSMMTPRHRFALRTGFWPSVKAVRLFANLRPVKVYDELVDSTNFKPEVIEGADFIFVRELTGGLYFGRPKRRWGTGRGRRAVDSMSYSETGDRPHRASWL